MLLKLVKKKIFLFIVDVNGIQLFGIIFLSKTNSHKKQSICLGDFGKKKKISKSSINPWMMMMMIHVSILFICILFFLHISLQIASIHHHRLFHYVVSIWWWWNDWNSGGSTIGRSGQSPRAQTKFFSSFSFNGGEREKLVQDVISAEGP